MPPRGWHRVLYRAIPLQTHAKRWLLRERVREGEFDLEGGAKLPSETELMTVGTASVTSSGAMDEASSKEENLVEEEGALEYKGAEPTTANATSAEGEHANRSVSLRISKAQFYEKTELLRDRFVNEAKKLGVSQAALKNVFSRDKASDGTVKGLTYAEFKRRLMDLKFSLTDIPDEDLLVLDADNSGTISPEEFLAFFQLGVSFSESENMPAPPAPVDDLVYKAADLEGVLNVKVLMGKDLRKPYAWFEDEAKNDESNGDGEGDMPSTAPTSRRALNPFDPEESKKKWFAEVDWKSPDVKKKTDVKKGGAKTANREGENQVEDDKLAPLPSPMKSRDHGENRSVVSHFTATTQAQEEGRRAALSCIATRSLLWPRSTVLVPCRHSRRVALKLKLIKVARRKLELCERLKEAKPRNTGAY